MNSRAATYAYNIPTPRQYIELLERVERMEMLIEYELIEEITPEMICERLGHSWISTPTGSSECRRCPEIRPRP